MHLPPLFSTVEQDFLRLLQRKLKQKPSNSTSLHYGSQRLFEGWGGAGGASEEVNCNGLSVDDAPTHDEFGNPLTTKSPTPSPVRPPNPLLEWEPKIPSHG